MSAFKVEQVYDQTRDWDGKGDSKFTSYYVKCEGDERRFEVVRKRGTEGPKVGEVIEATIETREHNGTTYYKLKKEHAGGFGGGGGKRDPATDRRITRQHSQDMGIETLKLAVQLGAVDKLPEIKGVSDILGIVKTLADAYDKDAYAAGEQA